MKRDAERLPETLKDAAYDFTPNKGRIMEEIDMSHFVMTPMFQSRIHHINQSDVPV
jgi:hypothetical protein